VGAAIVAILLPLPSRALVLAGVVVLAFSALATFWAPAMAMLSDAADQAGLDQALAFSISNLAWAAGHVFGAGAGGAVAEATSDAVPYGALAVACAATLVGLAAIGRREPATAG
jgi:predicted MFS family arabinose efflux permease